MTLAGRAFKDPLSALDSGAVSFTATYKTFRDAIKPNVIHYQQLTGGVAHTTMQALGRVSVSTVTGAPGAESLERVRLLDSAAAVLAALKALLESKPAQERLSDKFRRQIITTLEAKH